MGALYGALIAVDAVGAEEHLPPVPGGKAVPAYSIHGGNVHHPTHSSALVLLVESLVGHISRIVGTALQLD